MYVKEIRDTSALELRGRLIFVRKQGGIAFAKLQDGKGDRMQIGFRKADWETPEAFKEFIGQLHIGTIFCAIGTCSPSSTGELTFWASPKSHVIQQPLLTFPDKFHGIADDAVRIRKRYLDSVLNEETYKVFKYRHLLIQMIRTFLMKQYDFVEVETPILGAHASGANARPFKTHLNSKDADMYLRIAPETYLKRYVAAGFDRVFEIGKNFRNEGMDPSHLPEFTSVEWYGAHMTHNDNMTMFSNLLNQIMQWSSDGTNHYGYDERYHHPILPELWSAYDGELSYQGKRIDFCSITEYPYRELFVKHLGSYPEGLTWKERDLLFKKEIRPLLINPTYITDYPAEMAPLAARNKDNPELVDMWQLVINGWEIVKCYQELVDPVLQEQLLREQMAEKATDAEAMDLEPDFIECMKYGMPPMSGLGLGIDRLVCLLTNQTNLRDVVMFPVVL